MAHFSRPDSEGEGAQRAVRAGVAVAAHDGLSGLRDSELGPDDVYDSALRVAQTEQLDCELRTVDFQLAHLLRSRVNRDRRPAQDLLRARWRRVIHRREREVRPAYGQAALAKNRECLR